MFLITSKKDKRITDISTTIGYETNGNIILDNGTQIGCFREVDVHEVEEIPAGIVTEKYCYTEADGFYVNPNYVEPKEPIETRVDLIEERVTLAEDMINMSLGF